VVVGSATGKRYVGFRNRSRTMTQNASITGKTDPKPMSQVGEGKIKLSSIGDQNASVIGTFPPLILNHFSTR
jgi:hypothetical protein